MYHVVCTLPVLSIISSHKPVTDVSCSMYTFSSVKNFLHFLPIRIILCGPSGTGKTYLAQKLGEYLVQKSGKDLTESSILTFDVDQKSTKDLKAFLQVFFGFTLERLFFFFNVNHLFDLQCIIAN